HRPARLPAQLHAGRGLLARRRPAGERDAAATAVRHAPVRVAGRRRRVPPRARRMGRRAALERLGDRAPPRAPGPGGGPHGRVLRVRLGRLGEALAVRGDLGGAKGRMTLLLASTSPQRRAILTQLRIPFEAVTPDFVEAPGTGPAERAVGKARSVRADGSPVLGVDTEVVLDGRLLGKPGDAREAEDMLVQLAGRSHDVVSGLCLRTSAWEEVRTETTVVTFRRLAPRELEHYVAAGGGRGRAGRAGVPGGRAPPRRTHAR